CEIDRRMDHVGAGEAVGWGGHKGPATPPHPARPYGLYQTTPFRSLILLCLDSPSMQRQVDRAAAMAAVRREAEDAGAQVFGEGNLEAAMMLVGEAPGKQEAAAHRPFVGPAGIVLNRLLERAAIPRNKLWITNVVKVRPVAAGRREEVNRPPN